MNYLAAAKTAIWKSATDAVALMEKKGSGKGKTGGGKGKGKNASKDKGPAAKGGKGAKGKGSWGKDAAPGGPWGKGAAAQGGNGGKGRNRKELRRLVVGCTMNAEGKWNRATRDCCMICGQARGTVEDDGNWTGAESKTAAKQRKAPKDAALVR